MDIDSGDKLSLVLAVKVTSEPLGLPNGEVWALTHLLLMNIRFL